MTATTNPAFTPCADVRKRIIDNAKLTGKEAFPYTAMGVAMVEAAIR